MLIPNIASFAALILDDDDEDEQPEQNLTFWSLSSGLELRFVLQQTI